MGAAGRRRTATILVVAGAVALLLALLFGYARVAVVDSSQFANRATSALQSQGVREIVAEQVTDELILRKAADLQAARPLIKGAVAAAVGTPAFGAIFRRAALDLHRAVFVRDRDTATLTLLDAGTLAAEGLRQAAPDLAERLRAPERVDLVQERFGSVAGTLARAGDRVRALAWILLALALAALAAAVGVSRDRRRTVTAIGFAAVAVGLLLALALEIGRALLTAEWEADSPARAAAGAVWDAFLGDLGVAALVLAGCGAVVAAAATSLVRPVGAGATGVRLARAAWAEPTRPALRLLRALALAGAGLAAVLFPGTVLRLAVMLGGALLIVEGATAILRLIDRPAADGVPAVQTARTARSGPGRTRRRVAALAVAAALIAAAAVATFVGSGGATVPAPPLRACNGHAELCDRPLDRVVFAGTHNSMSAPGPGWFATQQDAGVAEQLEDGVRALLIDTWDGDRLADGRVRTDLTRSKIKARALREGVSPQSVQAARRLRERLGFRGEGRRGTFLCHAFCELGHVGLRDTLEEITAFLVTRPHEVVVLVVEDYVTPEAFVREAQRAGLADLIYPGRLDRDLPTLRELIEADRRVVFLSENATGGAPWYRQGFEGPLQETPFSFSRPEQLTDEALLPASCRDNRGASDAPFLLVNHWITTDPVPLPSNATKVNAREAMLRRARTCERLRGRRPWILAVDFYRRGDLFGVTDALNGVGG